MKISDILSIDNVLTKNINEVVDLENYEYTSIRAFNKKSLKLNFHFYFKNNAIAYVLYEVTEDDDNQTKLKFETKIDSEDVDFWNVVEPKSWFDFIKSENHAKLLKMLLKIAEESKNSGE